MKPVRTVSILSRHMIVVLANLTHMRVGGNLIFQQDVHKNNNRQEMYRFWGGIPAYAHTRQVKKFKTNVFR